LGQGNARDALPIAAARKLVANAVHSAHNCRESRFIRHQVPDSRSRPNLQSGWTPNYMIPIPAAADWGIRDSSPVVKFQSESTVSLS
jgi:hypothetical protein